MVVEVFTSRSGRPSLKIDGRAFHSPFDPEREAERFVESSLGTSQPSLVVLFGEGLGYLTKALTARFPGIRVISVRYSADLMRAAKSTGQDVASSDAWSPESATDVLDFFRTRIDELEVEGLRVIEWPAAARIFPGESRRAQEGLQQALRELNGSFLTAVGSGKLWARNSFANFLGIGSALRGRLCSPERPVVIAAPGPSLEQAAPLLRELRPQLDLWALPSSALFLHEHDIRPDIVVMTDPGFYAINHVRFAALPCPVVMPLSAARGLWGISAVPFLLSQPGLIEETLLAGVTVSAPRVSPHGTVSATALDLALASTKGPVIVTGLDLCMRDVASHARPNTFERLLMIQTGRCAPFDSLSYERSMDQGATPIEGGRGARASRSLRTYAGWFAGIVRPGRVFRLFPSVVELPGMSAIGDAELRALLRSLPASPAGSRLSPDPKFPPREERRRIVLRCLDGWLESISKGISAAEGPDGHLALGRRPVLFQLAYALEAQLLLESKRKARLGDAEGARSTVVEMLGSCARFLGSISSKVLDAG